MDIYMQDILVSSEKAPPAATSANKFSQEILMLCTPYISVDYIKSAEYTTLLSAYVNNINTLVAQHTQIASSTKLESDTLQKVTQTNAAIQEAKNQLNALTKERNDLTASFAATLQKQVADAESAYQRQVASNKQSIQQLEQVVKNAETNRANMQQQKRQKQAEMERNKGYYLKGNFAGVHRFGTMTVNINIVNDEVIATKTGMTDGGHHGGHRGRGGRGHHGGHQGRPRNVPVGQVAFKMHVAAKAGTGNLHVAGPGFTNPSWKPFAAVINNDNQFTITFASHKGPRTVVYNRC